jgi:gluconolactonase
MNERRFTADATDPHALRRDWSGAEPVAFPEPAWEIHDPRFDGHLPNAALSRLWTGGAWTEGPVWWADANCLLFSDIPNHRVLRWCADDGRVSVYDAASNYANGHTRDREGRILRCEHGTRAIVRRELDGSRRVLADNYQGKRLNAPNDLVVAGDGAVWFSDPTYGINSDYEGTRAAPELPTRVYRLDMDGQLQVMIEDMVQPNGLCFSPDGRILYVADSGGDPDRLQPDGTLQPANGSTLGPRHIRHFAVGECGQLSDKGVLADLSPGLPDGIRCDSAGRIWSSCAWGGAAHNGVRVYQPDGGLLATLHLPEVVSNIEFGGAKRNRLFITASQSLYAITVNASGARLP